MELNADLITRPGDLMLGAALEGKWEVEVSLVEYKPLKESLWEEGFFVLERKDQLYISWDKY